MATGRIDVIVDGKVVGTIKAFDRPTPALKVGDMVPKKTSMLVTRVGASGTVLAVMVPSLDYAKSLPDFQPT